MRRPDGYTTIKTGEMSNYPSKSSGIGVESHIDHMMTIIGSPLNRRKAGTTHKTFGVPISELVAKQADESKVPAVVRRLCEYIKDHGLRHEGIFRLNGNVKVIESLRMSFDKLGDANLEEIKDVVATASLLKLFLRELPEAVIPKYLHHLFVQAQEENCDNEEYLKQLLGQLPDVNFCTLRYLMAFLTQVAQHEHENRMSPTALGIVFGPNLFRVTENLEGLRQQSLTNQLVTRLIKNFSALFGNEISPEKKLVKSVQQLIKEEEKADKSQSSLSAKDGHLTELDDSFDQVSSVDSDTSSSEISPTVAVMATEFVDMAISKSVKQGTSKNQPLLDNSKPGTCTNRKTEHREPNNKHTECNGKHKEVPSYSEIISSDTVHPATPDTRRRDWGTFDDDYHENKRSMERSQPFQRVSKSRKIRRNVRKSQSLGSLENGINFIDKDSLKENEESKPEMGQSRTHNGRFNRPHCSHSFDLDASSDRPSHPFLELHPQPQARELHTTAESSQAPSPNTSHKSYVPPLDLSILHEHGDGSEPIPINRLRVSWPMMNSEKEEIDVMISPRTSQLKKKLHANLDPNVPPSPPIEQESFPRMNMKEDEAVTASIKHLNKRIYHLKRKIKQFEENFEEEYGYKPSHADKLARSEVKKQMAELSKARRDLKKFKFDSLQDVSSSHDELPLDEDVSSNTKPLGEDEKHAIEESLQEMLQDLATKRRTAHRPEDLKEMTQEEVQDEKVAIQKSLLQFESVFGRPSSKPEMNIMRPIYDRYRNVKRLLTKIGSPKAKEPGTELEPILEHEAMDFIQASPQHKTRLEEELATQEPTLSSDEIPDSKKAKKCHAAKGLNPSNLHELNTFELLEQHRKVKEEKKRLRRILHEFETEFQRQTGSQVKREDRAPLESLYGEYKQVKAKLRLLEALLSKHKTRYTV